MVRQPICKRSARKSSEALSRLLRKSARGCQGKQSSAQIFDYAGIDSPDRRCYAFRLIVYRRSRTTAEEPRSRQYS
jgi:hypothetical protein